MVKLNAITTRTGDEGTSGLVDGSRAPKSDLRFDAMGDIDETNAAIGLARTTLDAGGLDLMLSRIQNDLFDLGADLATPGDIDGALRITNGQTERLETDMAQLLVDLTPLDSFILPGGEPAAAALHHARTVARRAERTCVGLHSSLEAGLNPSILTYTNRLSDFLFVAARWCNDRGRADVKWVPGATRGT